MKILMYEEVGDFGEDKDAAAALRESKVRPCIKKSEKIIFDFDGVTLVTQSFIHALISDVLRTNGEKLLDQIDFKNCEEVVRGIISTVVQYSLDSPSDESSEESDDEEDERPAPREEERNAKSKSSAKKR